MKKKSKKNPFFTRYSHGFKIIGYLIVIVAWDFITKIITDGLNVTVLPGFFNFYSSHNSGAAWSILSRHTWILIVLTFLFLIAFFVFNYFFKQRTKTYSIGFSLVAGGAIGNLIDRLFLGYVRDFIALDFINFPTFNVADMCICVGVIILCIFFLFLYPKYNKKLLKSGKKFNISKALKLSKKEEK